LNTAAKPAAPPIFGGAVGLGLRRALLGDFVTEICRSCTAPRTLDFVELAPENWLDVGGQFGAALERIASHIPIVAHGLSLSLGGTDALDAQHLCAIKGFLERYDVAIYSEHLSATAIDGHLYDLAPLPFNESMVRHIAGRIRETQDRLGRRIAVENSSYYLRLSDELSELEFINAVLSEADCDLLLDVNNVYVNCQNHGEDALAFLHGINPQRVRYLHVAGHQRESESLIVDTHGAPVPDPVWQLLRHSYQHFGLRPTLVERDFHFPPFSELLAELHHARQLQTAGKRTAAPPHA
jgi:uncharacterized protein